MTETTALGAAMAAGGAEGVAVWNLHEDDAHPITCDVFQPTISQTGQYFNSFLFKSNWFMGKGFII